MIDSREILEAARALSLEPRVVEKDYVLGWLLAGISAHPALSAAWVFKGGTCLKKCYFETYRFSEDLDFTVTDPSQIDERFLREAFTQICHSVYETSGIETFPKLLRFETYANPRGGPSCTGRFYYRGPVSPRGDPPMVKLDLTSDELLVLEPITREVAHPYSDNPPGGIHVPCYAFEEIFAEKMRALAERCRPRDLYDVVHLYRREEAETVAPEVTRVLAAKCKYKGIEVPRLSSLNRRRDELVADWSNMLAHQVQVLPPIDDFWNELQLVFAALEGPAPRPRPTPIHAPAAGAAILRGEAVRGAVHLPAGPSAMERLYFAAANRLCVDLGYNARVRRIEPYSLRRTRDGHLLLYGCKATTGETRAYRVDRIQSVAVAHQGFSPRHIVELTDRGPLSIPPARYRQSVSGMSIGRRRLAPSSTSRRGFGKPAGGAPGGLRHIYECPVCGRRFTRQQRSNSLRPHKTKDGFPCPGRRATFVESRC